MVMLIASYNKKCISLSVNEFLMNPESRVIVRGVTLDDRLTFNEHVSVRRSKVARQLNA